MKIQLFDILSQQDQILDYIQEFWQDDVVKFMILKLMVKEPDNVDYQKIFNNYLLDNDVDLRNEAIKKLHLFIEYFSIS